MVEVGGGRGRGGGTPACLWGSEAWSSRAPWNKGGLSPAHVTCSSDRGMNRVQQHMMWPTLLNQDPHSERCTLQNWLMEIRLDLLQTHCKARIKKLVEQERHHHGSFLNNKGNIVSLRNYLFCCRNANFEFIDIHTNSCRFEFGTSFLVVLPLLWLHLKLMGTSMSII